MTEKIYRKNVVFSVLNNMDKRTQTS